MASAQRAIFQWMAISLVCCLTLVPANSRFLQALEAVLDRPIAVAISGNREYAFVANQNHPSILVIETNTFATRQIEGPWQEMVDLVACPQPDRLLAIAKSPPQIMEISVAAKDPIASRAHSLSGIPAKLAVSLDGQFVCVSMTWEHAICLIRLTDQHLPELVQCEMVPLDFQPKEVLALKDGKFLVADAFGGRLAVVDARSAKIMASHSLHGHHIGGLARDDSQSTIAITHQKLSSVAHTNRDDIHWGSLIQNTVSVIAESLLTDPASKVSALFQRTSLGHVEKGAADPSGIAAWDGRIAIAISGSNQIAYRSGPKKGHLYMDVGQSPSLITHIGGSKFLWLSTLGNSLGIIRGFADRIDSLYVLGKERPLRTSEDRGEVAFFSGTLSHDGWMSCSSCHVDGHSPDLLADTQSDNGFGNPKRIPSLLNTAKTKPWTWNGGAMTLEEQIFKTLGSTMHRDAKSRSISGDDESVSKDIAAYLRKLELPIREQPQSEDLRRGKSLFASRGCDRCHRPKLNYTSPDTYDVGIVDELGESRFNPPSLEGVLHRKAYFHDGRYKSLEVLLGSHPGASEVWTDEELTQIVMFLNSL